MIEYKVEQQRLIVLLALYLLSKNNYHHPSKRHVLNFILMRNLVAVPDNEAVRRRPSDKDTIWENDLCFRRKDLLSEGLVGDEEYGCWNITAYGLRHIEERSLKWLRLEEPVYRDELLSRHKYLTQDLLGWMLKVAKGEDLNLRAVSAPVQKWRKTAGIKIPAVLFVFMSCFLNPSGSWSLRW